MKKELSFLLLVSVLISCSESDIGDAANSLSREPLTTGELTHHVSYGDVVALTQAQAKATRSKSDSSSKVECITSESNDTLLYVVNKQGGGWTIYSSDTRVPAIVAQSDEGSYEDLMQNEHAMIWIQTMAEDIGLIKTLDDEQLNFTTEEIESNKAFWKSISSPDEFVKELLGNSTTKSGKHPPIPIGHYELIHTETYSEVYDSISRLITTLWHQYHPYNYYCPYRSDTTNVHAPAGCVPIAGGQMLCFLHFKYGMPQTAPSEAYCYSDVSDYPYYNWNQTNYNYSVWNDMIYSGSYAAPLIANIGKRLNMEYGNSSSSTNLNNLVNNVFAPYGISCSFSSFNSDTLKSSLMNGIPVILGAHYSTTESGHAFIADRYRRKRNVTKNYYGWVWDYIPPLTPIPDYPEKVEYTYSSPIINMIGMNWGCMISLWNYHILNEWYSLTGDWIIETDSGVHNYNIARKMIYGFRPTDN